MGMSITQLRGRRIIVAVLCAAMVFCFIPLMADRDGVSAAAGDPTIEYGYAPADDGKGYVCFSYEKDGTAQTTATVSGGAFNTGLTAADIDATKLPKGLALTGASATATTLTLSFGYTKGNLLFDGVPWVDAPKIGVLDISVKPTGFAGSVTDAVAVPVVAEVVKKNEIPLGARLYREFYYGTNPTTGEAYGGFEHTYASQTDYAPDVVPSPYYTENDYYSRGGKLGTLYLLPNYKTIQQATGYSCGVTSELTMIEYWGKRTGQTLTGTTIKFDLNEYDLSKMRDGSYTSVSARDYGGATSQGEAVNVFDALEKDFGQSWNYVSGEDLLANAGKKNMKTFVYDSKPDINVLKGKLQGNKYDMTLFDAVKWYIRHGVPVLIGWNTWGGHYEVAVGYDTMGTKDDTDDVLIVMDPYDSTDQLKDGYITRSWKRFVNDWSVGGWGKSDNGTLKNFVFVAAWPDTYSPTKNTYTKAVTGSKLKTVASNKLRKSYAMPASKTKAYKARLKAQVKKLGKKLTPLAVKTDHKGSPYYIFTDPYKLKSKNKIMLKNFGTISQAGANLDGPASLLMAMNYYKSQGKLTEIDLAGKKGSSKVLKKTTLADMIKMVKKAPGSWGYYSTADMGKKAFGTVLDEFNTIDVFLTQGIPVLILTHEGGDAWQVVVGIDHGKTPNESQDDVLILADPQDVYDHDANGFTTFPFEYLAYDWYNSISGTKSAYQAFVAIYPKMKVTFDVNGGRKLSKKSSTKTVGFGKTYGKLPTPKKSGKTFAGWYTKAKGGKKVTSATTVAKVKAHKLYAHWK